MTTGLAWLNELMVWLGKWFPRLVLIKATQQGVVFGRRGDVRALNPSLHCYWPITTEVVLVSTIPRTTEIAAQLQGSEVVSLCVQYSIVDPRTALTSLNDLFATLDDRAQALLAQAYVATDTSVDIAARVHQGLTGEFGPCGIVVHDVSVIQRGWALPLKNMNDWAQHAKADLA
jgi:hypothetical protein